MVVSVPEPPGRFEESAPAAAWGHAPACGAVHRTKAAGILLQLRHLRAAPCVRANEVRVADRHLPRSHAGGPVTFTRGDT